MTEHRRIVWTVPAAKSLETLPDSVRRTIIEKADRLLDCPDVRKLYKPLQGPLTGCYSIKVSRYRAVFRVDSEEIGNYDVSVNITIQFVVAGKRKEGDRKDVYKMAQRLVELGVFEVVEGGLRYRDRRGKSPP